MITLNHWYKKNNLLHRIISCSQFANPLMGNFDWKETSHIFLILSYEYRVHTSLRDPLAYLNYMERRHPIPLFYVMKCNMSVSCSITPIHLFLQIIFRLVTIGDNWYQIWIMKYVVAVSTSRLYMNNTVNGVKSYRVIQMYIRLRMQGSQRSICSKNAMECDFGYFDEAGLCMTCFSCHHFQLDWITIFGLSHLYVG